MKNQPTHNVWMVEDVIGPSGDPTDFWTKIGDATERPDGTLDVRLSAMPFNGRIVIRARLGAPR